MIYTYSVNKIIKPSELKEIIENSLLIPPIYVTFNAENNTLIIKFNSTLNASEITILNNLIDDYVTIIDEVILSGHSQLILDDGTNPHGTTKGDIGLGDVNNTSDLNKPISKATLSALDNKQNLLSSYSLSVSDDNLSTTNSDYDLMVGMQKSGLVSGNYLFSFGGWMSQSIKQGEIFTEIYVNGTPVSGSEMKFKIGRINNGTHNYSNFPLNNVPNNGTVEVKWKVNRGTGTITNRYFTIFKI